MTKANHLEMKISLFLRIGVLISGLLLFSGWIMNFDFSRNPFYTFDTYDQIALKDLIEFHLSRKDWANIVSYLGLISLILLPVIRVFLTFILFLKQKEYLLSLVSISVFLGLIVSMLMGVTNH